MVLLLFVAVPIWAMITLPMPWEIYRRLGTIPAVLVATTYWVVPLFISFCLVSKSFWMLPAFVVECISLIALITFYYAPGNPTQDLLLSSCIFIMVFLGLGIINRDALYPFLSDGRNTWRKVPRLTSNKLVQLKDTMSGETCHVVVADISGTGLGIYGSKRRLEPLLQGRRRGERYSISFGTGDETISMDVNLMWSRKEELTLSMGVEVLDQSLLNKMIGSFNTVRGSNLISHWLARYWGRRPIRVLILSMWVLSVVGSLTIPVVTGTVFNF